ncbi:MAG: hypothetical protein LBC28_02410 [Oscillospiraceae bacterium]|jgi:hypothetical protein|nr:hypothetical protein [Oscillospiraceae bacterium]
MERDTGSPANPIGGEKEEEFTLESILAEYKGSSYIEGDKRTPKDVLDEKARRIVLEETGGAATPDDAPERENAPESAPAEPLYDDAPESAPDDGAAYEAEYEETEDAEYAEYAEYAEREEAPETAPPEREPLTFEADDDALTFFENYRYSSSEPEEELVRSVAAVIEGAERDEQGPKRRRRFFGSERAERDGDESGFYDEPEEEAERPEPDYRERARVYAARCNSLSGRAVPALALSAFIAVLTLIFDGGGSMPFGIGRNVVYARGALLLAQLAVMLLGVDVLLRGAKELFLGKASAETLVFASCAVSVLAGIYGLRSGGAALPYSAPAALSLAFALWGERLYTYALADTLRTAATVQEAQSVVSEYRRDLEKTVLKKTMGRRRGFYDNLTEKDLCETAFGYLSPLMLIFCVVIAVYSALAHGGAEYIPAMLAATTTASAVFTAATAFAGPFRSAARRAKARDAAIAGAGGADDIFYIDGCCISDDDIYPPDTLEIGGTRILEQVPPEKALRYTASLIVASGSCLARKFSEILVKEGMSLLTTQDFAVSEGGVSGMIRGENVIVGNYAFMNLHGVRVPDELKLGNSVYTAVNNRLTAVFSVEYRPSGVIRNAMLSVLRYSSRLFLTVRDFNITPMTIEQRFKVPMEDFEILPIRSTYDLGDDTGGGRARAAAICGRGGLPELSELIFSARRMKILTQIMTIISVAASVTGAFMMALRVWSGGVGAAGPGKLLLFMLAPPVIAAALEIISGLRRK